MASESKIRRNWRLLLIWILKANFISWIFDFAVFAMLILLGFGVYSLAYAGYFSKMLFLECGVIFVIGGAIAFSGSLGSSKTKEYIRKSDEQWSIEKLRTSEKRANKYIILAVILFFESILISFFGV